MLLLKVFLGLLIATTLYGPPIAGPAVYYGESWGDWLGPADSPTGIAARQGVGVPAGVTPIAHWDCSKLGTEGLLWLGKSGPISVIVADCTAAEDVALVRSRDIVVEVPYEMAEQYGFVGRSVDATLRFRKAGDPPPASRWRVPMGTRPLQMCLLR